MIAYLAAYAASAVVFLTADMIWLTLAGPSLYRPIIGPLLADRLNGPAAIAFYVVYVAGIVFLAVQPALKTGLWRTAAVHGLVLGLVAYATYDLTNQATLKLWATKLTLVDMAWGGGLTAIAATAGFLAANKLGGLRA
jgi:uncharacterized membrane protein